MRRYVPPIEKATSDKHWNVSTTGLRASIDHLEREAVAFAGVRDSVLGATPSNATLQRTNQSLMRVERALTRPEGLRTRPWFRNLIYVADENNGYANMPLPSVNEAIRANNENVTRAEVDDLTARFERAAQAVTEARESLRVR
jgi:N-acetylated-alpha-linked acidic dipeptidase